MELFIIKLIINMFMTGLVIWVTIRVYKDINASNVDIIKINNIEIQKSKGIKNLFYRLIIPMLFLGGIAIGVILITMWSML